LPWNSSGFAISMGICRSLKGDTRAPLIVYCDSCSTRACILMGGGDSHVTQHFYGLHRG
jgi:hypothetical protein